MLLSTPRPRQKTGGCVSGRFRVLTSNSTVKVKGRRNVGFKSHPKDWRNPELNQRPGLQGECLNHYATEASRCTMPRMRFRLHYATEAFRLYYAMEAFRLYYATGAFRFTTPRMLLDITTIRMLLESTTPRMLLESTTPRMLLDIATPRGCF